MKKIILIALFFIPLSVFAQTPVPIDNFMGIKFGSDVATVEAAVLAKGGKLDEERSTFSVMEFNGITVGKRKNISLEVKFRNNMAYRANFSYTVEPTTKAIQYYEGVVNDLNLTFGRGVSSVAAHERTSDLSRVQDIKSKNAIYVTFWDNTNHIMATIDTSLKVVVFYMKD